MIWFEHPVSHTGSSQDDTWKTVWLQHFYPCPTLSVSIKEEEERKKEKKKEKKKGRVRTKKLWYKSSGSQPKSPDEIKRREVSWTLTKKLAQKRSRAGRWCWARERESQTFFASVVSQRLSYVHHLCDSVLQSCWDSNCVVWWSLRNARRTLP